MERESEEMRLNGVRQNRRRAAPCAGRGPFALCALWGKQPGPRPRAGRLPHGSAPAVDVSGARSHERCLLPSHVDVGKSATKRKKSQ